MNRREFIKGTITITVAGLLAHLLPGKAQAKTEVCSFRGKLYKGNRSGQIFASSDGGASWQQLVDFGKITPVVAVRSDGDQLHAVLETPPGGHRFTLRSTDGRVWRTQGYVPFGDNNQPPALPD